MFEVSVYRLHLLGIQENIHNPIIWTSSKCLPLLHKYTIVLHTEHQLMPRLVKG